MILSDAIHQSRAALDNLVTSLRGREGAGTYFPIRAERGAYEEIEGDALAGVPDWARKRIREMQPFSPGHLSFIGSQLEELDALAKRDRHRAPPLQVALLRPDYVESNEGARVEFRGDLATWAEVEHVIGKVVGIHFKVEVQFDETVPHAGRFDVSAWTEWMVRQVQSAVEVIRQASYRHG